LAENRQMQKNDQGPDATRLQQAIERQLGDLMGEALAPALYLVATPIGNLADVTLRALAILTQAGLVYCEDTRHSRHLLEHYGISRRLKSYHEHNAEQERPRILAELEAGRSVALMSDAGTPLISDPGFKLVREALEAGIAVRSVPGSSAPLVALTSSGLPPHSFLFAGFLPVKSTGRRARLAELKAIPATLIFFEAPSRLAESLSDMADVLGATRIAAVARELTKRHEEVRRGTVAELAAWAAEGGHRGELVVLVAPATTRDVGDNEIRDQLGPALSSMSVRDASKTIADELGVPKSRVYDLAVRMKRGEA
jgi:16S rRNA (cytidine1402-2'-O)-methyltransferase